jgi:hypothetical protein
VNGRAWLARQLDARNTGYLRADNACESTDLEGAGELSALRRPGLVPAARRPGPPGQHHQVGIASNHRYLDALAATTLKGEGVAPLDALFQSKAKDGRRHARSNPLSSADRALFRAVLAGGHAIAGLRNADLVRRL